jgi:hypothetical protein
MAGQNTSTYAALLKTLYTDQKIENLVYNNRPTLALLKKYEAFGGDSLKIPVVVGNPQNTSPDFATAQALSSTSISKAFFLTRVKEYGFAEIDTETLEASKGNPNAFIEAFRFELDNAINGVSEALSTMLFKSGWGDIGVIATGGVSGSTITLSQASDITNWEVNMSVVFASTQSSSALRSATPLLVTGLDRDAGTVTFSASLASVNAVAGDWCFIQGARQNSGSPTAIALSGFESWIPSVAPTSTLFYGVDRSSDVTRLGGIRYNATGLDISEALIQGAAKVGREGGKLTHFVMSFDNFAAWEKSLTTRVRITDNQMNPDVGFESIPFTGPTGKIEVYADPKCPSNRIYGLDINSWRLNSLGKAVKILNADGNDGLRSPTADSVQYRVGFKGNLSCNAPGRNINIQI